MQRRESIRRDRRLRGCRDAVSRLTRPAALVALIAVAGCEPFVPTDNGYDVVWEDHFNGRALSSQWHTEWENGPIVVSNGTVKLTTTTPSTWTGIATKGPRSDSQPQYPDIAEWEEGYFEARIRYEENAYSWPAFWLFSSARAQTYPVRDAHCPTLVSEIDVMEGLVPRGHPTKAQRVTHTLHENTQVHADDEDGSCGRLDDMRHAESFGTAGLDLSDWHVWGARWTSEEVCWYLDGFETGCQPTFESTAQPMHIILTAQWYPCRDWLYGTACPAQPASQTTEVDWVRVYQEAP